MLLQFNFVTVLIKIFINTAVFTLSLCRLYGEIKIFQSCYEDFCYSLGTFKTTFILKNTFIKKPVLLHSNGLAGNFDFLRFFTPKCLFSGPTRSPNVSVTWHRPSQKDFSRNYAHRFIQKLAAHPYDIYISKLAALRRYSAQLLSFVLFIS